MGKEGNRWKSAYYAPGACDAAVVAWRQWLDRWGGEVPTCRAQDPLPPLLPKEQVRATHACNWLSEPGWRFSAVRRACAKEGGWQWDAGCTGPREGA